MHTIVEMQFISNCFIVVSYKEMFRHSIYKNSAVYRSDSMVTFFDKIQTYGSLSTGQFNLSNRVSWARMKALALLVHELPVNNQRNQWADNSKAKTVRVFI